MEEKEYAVECYYTADDKFQYQVDVFVNYQDAENLKNALNKQNNDKSVYFDIILIKYKDDVEVGVERNI